ncbi:MAG: hypothetical protein Q8L81_10345 [Bacteroidota bacterium]|nr:hypothetical protein [Bacteroidota bacterium]
MFKNLTIIIFLIFATCACNKKKSLASDDYIKYLNSKDGGLINLKEFNDIVFKAKIQTPEMIALSYSSGSEMNQIKYKKDLQDHKGQINFIVLIEDANSNKKVKEAVVTKETYGQILAYGNTGLKDDFKLIQGVDTIYCSLVIVEPANSLQPIVRIALSFSGVNSLSESDLTLIYNDKIFNQGPIKFNYSKSTFQNIPDLKL